MSKRKIAILFTVAVSTSILVIILLNPNRSIVCDDFLGGRLMSDATRGIQCECAGWKLYLKHDAPADGRDLSLCLGLIKKSVMIR